MNPLLAWLLAIPLEFRLLALAALGACAGSLINLAAYRLAWKPRAISPWSRPDPAAPPRTFGDRLPIVGWLGLARESSLHGPGFWIRPMLIEAFTAALFAWLYWWEVDQQALLIPQGLLPLPAGFPPAPPISQALHAQCAVHLLLACVMLAASLIDLDEKYIPDSLMVPATLAGLVLAAAYPWLLLPANTADLNRDGVIDAIYFLEVTSSQPIEWPQILDERPNPWSLLIALACYWSWCVLLLPRPWLARRGLKIAVRILARRMLWGYAGERGLFSWLTATMALAGAGGIVAVWFVGGVHWIGLMTALVGMAAGAGVIWMVRIIGTAVLRREAMGLGDVTLLAMIGTVVGWQSCLIIFFLAPFCGLLFALAQLIFRRDPELCYGPFLCMATLALIVFWAKVWERAWAMFGMGWLVPGAMVGVFGMLAVMLAVWMGIKRVI